MDITETLTFDDTDRADLYDYVESHGSVREDVARRALNMDQTAFGHHVTVLRREGYIRKVGNKLQVAYTPEAAEVHELDGLEVTIRTVEEGDRDGLVAAVRSVAEEGSYIEAETVRDVLDHEDALIRHNNIRSRIFFVAEVDDELVGWCHLDLPETEKLGHTAVLTVGIAPGYRGHGIGGELLDWGVSWAADRGFEKLYNSVPATNERAISFLEEHGWEVEAVRADHYKMDGDYVDETMMAYDLR